MRSIASFRATHYRSRTGLRSGVATTADGPIILFDGVCVLCTANAHFILKHDTVRHFRLAAMQSEAGAALCRARGVDPAAPETILLVERDRVRSGSDAVLAICAGLAMPWQLLGALRIVPAAVREPVYRCVARHRYRLFGRRATCWVALAADRDRIL